MDLLLTVTSRVWDCLAASAQVESIDVITEEPQPKRRRTERSNSIRGVELASRVSMPASDELLPPRGALECVVDAYFVNLHNQPYSLFHEGGFRERLKSGALPDHLLLAVMASAVCFCQHPSLAADKSEAAIRYANKSWKAIISNYFTASKRADLFIVQTLALLALFDFTGNFSRFITVLGSL